LMCMAPRTRARRVLLRVSPLLVRPATCPRMAKLFSTSRQCM